MNLRFKNPEIADNVHLYSTVGIVEYLDQWYQKIPKYYSNLECAPIYDNYLKYLSS